MPDRRDARASAILTLRLKAPKLIGAIMTGIDRLIGLAPKRPPTVVFKLMSFSSSGFGATEEMSFLKAMSFRCGTGLEAP